MDFFTVAFIKDDFGVALLALGSNLLSVLKAGHGGWFNTLSSIGRVGQRRLSEVNCSI